jgi:hypothetical protein
VSASCSSRRKRPARRPSSSSEAKTRKKFFEDFVKSGADADGDSARMLSLSSWGRYALASSLVVPAITMCAPCLAKRLSSVTALAGSEPESPQTQRTDDDRLPSARACLMARSMPCFMDSP